MAGECEVNSTDINFVNTTNPALQVIRWLKFCKFKYIYNCKLENLEPPLTDISGMLALSTYSDCMNTRQLTAYCISLILSILIILANSVIIFTFLKNRELFTCFNLPIFSLTMSDLLTGLMFVYTTSWNLVILTAGYDFDIGNTMYYIRKRSNKYLCLTLDGPGLLFACMMSSALSLGLIAIDRYIAIFHPFRYQEWITMPRMITCTVGLWVISVVIGLLPLTGWSNWEGRCTLTEVIDYSYLAFWSAACFTIGLMILIIYIRIFVLTQKHFRQIKAAQITISSNTTSVPDSNVTFVGETGDTENVHENGEAFTITADIHLPSSGARTKNSVIEEKQTTCKVSDAGKDNVQILTDIHLPNNDGKQEDFAFDDKQPIKSSQENVSCIGVVPNNQNGPWSKSFEDNDDERDYQPGHVQQDSVYTEGASVLQNTESETPSTSGNSMENTNNMIPQSTNYFSGRSVVTGKKTPKEKHSKNVNSKINSTNTDNWMNSTSENNIINSTRADYNLKMNLTSTNSMMNSTNANIKINTKSMSTQRAHENNDSSLNTGNKSQKDVLNIKAITTTGMILGAFYICWLPFLVFLLGFQDKYDQNLTVYYLAIVTQINSLINPLLYGFRQMDIKRAMKKQCNIGDAA